MPHFSLSIHLLINIWVVSTFGVLWAMLRWTLVYKFLHGHIFITLGCLYLGVELLDHVAVIQSLGCVQLFATPWTAAHWASLSFTISRSLFKLMSIELMMPPNHLNLCHPFLFLLSIFPSIRVFSNESALRIGWPKYWSFGISPSNQCSGLIFRIDWFDLLGVQETLKSLF